MAERAENRNECLMPDAVALWVATAGAWVLVRAWSPASAPEVPGWCLPCIAVPCIILAARVERRRGSRATASPWWFWAAYVTAVTLACAYYLEQRGAIVTPELALPTLAALLALLPVRLRARRAERRRAADPRVPVSRDERGGGG